MAISEAKSKLSSVIFVTWNPRIPEQRVSFSLRGRILYTVRYFVPGGKNKPFWTFALTVVEVALKENNIKSLRINQRSGGGAAIQKFRKDPDILVLLLDG